ncbi:MAG: serine/threonine-protein phosphatase, partial [Oscillospiraceae bacterium]|nr:serine/threonine-protein phosphatase [Oscillospiraceae bacterium]
MNFLTALHTDIGIKKKTNQDSALILEAETEKGKVLLAVICDGMGGLAKGELASATAVRAFDTWFQNELPAIMEEGFDAEILCKSWEDIIYDVNTRVGNFAKVSGFDLGTTA